MLYPNSQIMPRRASFMTVFTSGAVAFTKNYRGGVESVADDFHASGLGPAVVPQEEAPKAPEASRAGTVCGLLMGLGAAGAIYLSATNRSIPHWAYLAGVGVVLVGMKLLGGGRATPQQNDEPDMNYRAPLDEVLAKHREIVERFIQEGHVPVSGKTEDAFLQIQQTYYEHRVVSGLHRAAEIMNLIGMLIFLLAPAGIVAAFCGLDHAAPWAVMLFSCAIVATFRYGMSTATVVRVLHRLFENKSTTRPET
jgi:hypothetical protein